MSIESQFIDRIFSQWARRVDDTPASRWVEENIVLNEPAIKGPFTFEGREYLREIVDSWSIVLPEGLSGATDFIGVMGTGAAKTIGNMAGMAYRIMHDPMRALIVKPTGVGSSGAKTFCKSRFKKMLEASRCFKPLIPKGAKRFDYANSHIEINGSIMDFVGANSVAQLGENRCNEVWQDEVDKYPEQKDSDKEASPIILADERTKSVFNPRRHKFSTPTVTGVQGIWEEFKKTDQRRRFMPCPHCQKFVVIAWSKKFTVFTLRGDEAFVAWGEKAKNADGTWDLDRVAMTAHYVCPHCQGKITDGHKAWMDKNGIWKSTATGAPGYVGWHLPSMYSQSAECNVGAMAKKFLIALHGISGAKGFINSDLAEPSMQQELSTERYEKICELKVDNEWVRMMSIDCQQKSPYYWTVVRAFSGKKTHGIVALPADSEDELEEIQKKNHVTDAGVFMDSGWGAKTDVEVYRTCAGHTEFVKSNGMDIGINGWMPTKGFPSRKTWPDKETKVMRPFRIIAVDPLMGTTQARKALIEMLEFSGDPFKDMLERLRHGKAGGYEWSVSEQMDKSEFYWRHMDAEERIRTINKRTNYEKVEWAKKSPKYPNHLFDCEVILLVAAVHLEILDADTFK